VLPSDVETLILNLCYQMWKLFLPHLEVLTVLFVKMQTVMVRN